MDNHKAIINVKGVLRSEWEAAKRGATQRQESMGAWLSGAISIRVARDAGEVKPPDKNDRSAGNPDALTPDQLTERMHAVAAMMQGAAAMKQAKIRMPSRSVIVTAQAYLEARLIEAEPPPLRQISGKAVGKDSGKSGNPVILEWDGMSV